MNRTTSIDLGDHLTRFVETAVGDGRYNNKSDAIRAGVRLLEEHEAKLAALRAALVEGEASGVSERSVAEIWKTVKEEQRRSSNG